MLILRFVFVVRKSRNSLTAKSVAHRSWCGTCLCREPPNTPPTKMVHIEKEDALTSFAAATSTVFAPRSTKLNGKLRCGMR